MTNQNLSLFWAPACEIPTIGNPYFQSKTETERLALQLAGELGAKITGKPPQLLRSQVKLFYDNPLVMNINKARTELGYDPRDGETAVRQARDYLLEDSYPQLFQAS